MMSARCQAAITLSRIVFSCDGWLQRAVLISHIRIIHLQEFFFISWAGSRVKDDCYVGRTHRSLQDKLELIVCSMFTVPNVFGAWHCGDISYMVNVSTTSIIPYYTLIYNTNRIDIHIYCSNKCTDSSIHAVHFPHGSERVHFAAVHIMYSKDTILTPPWK